VYEIIFTFIKFLLFYQGIVPRIDQGIVPRIELMKFLLFYQVITLVSWKYC